jgi:hypothetical protein
MRDIPSRDSPLNSRPARSGGARLCHNARRQFNIASASSALIKNSTFINETTSLILVDAGGTQRLFNRTQFTAFETIYAPDGWAVDLGVDRQSGTVPAAAFAVNARRCASAKGARD